jgi:hypothetical protein
MARWLGNAGEKIVSAATGLTKNTKPIELTFSGTARVPDFWNTVTRTIYEVKNVSQLSLDSQIRDMMIWAVQNQHKFQLWVREGAELSPTLQSAINAGLIQIQWFQFGPNIVITF